MQIKNKELRITPASFHDAMALQRAIGRAIKQEKIGINLDGVNKENILESELGDTIGDVLNAIISVGISKEVEDCAFQCAKRALYDNNQISSDFFEPVENRDLYFPIMIEIIKVNIAPFLKGLFSGFTGLQEKIKSILK